MKNLFRALLAGWGAKKMGGRSRWGCFGVIIVFIIIYVLLGPIFNMF